MYYTYQKAVARVPHIVLHMSILPSSTARLLPGDAAPACYACCRACAAEALKHEYFADLQAGVRTFGGGGGKRGEGQHTLNPTYGSLLRTALLYTELHCPTLPCHPSQPCPALSTPALPKPCPVIHALP